MKSVRTILIAGPYRSGTGDDPLLMEENLRRLEDAALILFRAGHLPLIGEWLALPLLRIAGSKKIGDAIFDETLYPVAASIISRCDALLRLPGASQGADQDVNIALRKNIPVFYSLEDLLKNLT